MPRTCSLCQHPELKRITEDLMRRTPYRVIQSRYEVSKSAIDRHVSGHVSKALRRLAAAESTVLADAAAIAAPVLGEMRKLNARALRILNDAEMAKDRATALAAIRECRRNLELIAKLTGELDPRTAGETPGGPLQVTVVYQDRRQMLAGQETPSAYPSGPAAESLPRLEGPGGAL